jgi:hypothetical protein
MKSTITKLGRFTLYSIVFSNCGSRSRPRPILRLSPNSEELLKMLLCPHVICQVSRWVRFNTAGCGNISPAGRTFPEIFMAVQEHFVAYCGVDGPQIYLYSLRHRKA